jgi:hypothetical protein
VITKINGQSVTGFPIGSLAGKTARLTVIRSGGEVEIPIPFGSRTVKGFELVGVPNPSKQQSRVRDAWLKR